MDKNLSEQARQEKIDYYRAWRKRNKDKIKKYNTQYWERRIAKAQAQQETAS